ncbi:MAG: GntR family transcriptional regulator [Anaerolineaceae bacterium]|nr:GntR family transcriptional regulator [Anaerolineaceae bacterium]
MNPSISGTNPFQNLQTRLAGLVGATQPGERLPAEPELARQMGVSRATLREAMRTLESAGLIRRRQGVGTFVVSTSHVIDTGLEVLESIESLASKMQLDVAMGALKITEVEASEEQAEIFSVLKGTPLVQVSRVIFAENRPVAYLVDVLPEDILKPEDLQQEFTGSVLDFLMRHGTYKLANSLTEIQAVAASSEIARALEIQRGDVLLLFIARLFTTMGKTVDHSLSFFLPGYFRFHVIRKVEQLT